VAPVKREHLITVNIDHVTLGLSETVGDCNTPDTVLKDR